MPEMSSPHVLLSTVMTAGQGTLGSSESKVLVEKPSSPVVWISLQIVAYDKASCVQETNTSFLL
jgi:hypothetical protein